MIVIILSLMIVPKYCSGGEAEEKNAWTVGRGRGRHCLGAWKVLKDVVRRQALNDCYSAGPIAVSFPKFSFIFINTPHHQTLVSASSSEYKSHYSDYKSDEYILTTPLTMHGLMCLLHAIHAPSLINNSMLCFRSHWRKQVTLIFTHSLLMGRFHWEQALPSNIRG